MQTHTRPGRCLAAISGILLIAALSAPSLGEVLPGAEVDFNALIADTQKQTLDPNRMTLVWWLPAEFWQWSMAQDSGMTADGVAGFLEVMEPYVMVVVVDGKIGPLGGVTFIDPDELKAQVRLVDDKGVEYKPLQPDDISPDVVNLASMMRPMLANMLGPAGENMGIYVFHSIGREGMYIARAGAKGSFGVKVREESFEWATPLGSVLRPLVCPVDGAELNGTWSYCPWHGKKLESSPG